MKFSTRHIYIVLILAFLASVFCATPQLADAAAAGPARVPHNAFSKVARDDLLTPLRQQGEVRVIVGLQTPQEIAQLIDATPD